MTNLSYSIVAAVYRVTRRHGNIKGNVRLEKTHSGGRGVHAQLTPRQLEYFKLARERVKEKIENKYLCVL